MRLDFLPENYEIRWTRIFTITCYKTVFFSEKMPIKVRPDLKVRSYAIEFSFSIARCVKSIHPITLYMVCPYAEQFEVSFDVPFNLLHSRITE